MCHSFHFNVITIAFPVVTVVIVNAAAALAPAAD